MQQVQDHLWIFCSIMCNMFSAVMIKVQVNKVGAFPSDLEDRFQFFLRLFLNPWIWISLFATFLAGLLWMVAMTKFKLSYAYPFTALGYACILLLSLMFLSEAMTLNKIIGVVLISVGIIVSCQN